MVGIRWGIMDSAHVALTSLCSDFTTNACVLAQTYISKKRFQLYDSPFFRGAVSALVITFG